VREGSFREDLYYRLNVVNLTIPALRERTGDVSLLARGFAESFAARNSRRISGISPAAMSVLEAHTWNGNIRELENVIEGAVLTAREGGMIEPSDIRIEYRRPLGMNGTGAEAGLGVVSVADLSGWVPGRTLDQIEKNVILDALKHHEGNRTHTARALGISIRTLRNKLADYRRDGLDV